MERIGYFGLPAVGFLLIIVLATGCVPSRSEYFNELEQRRSERYDRWEDNSTDKEFPQISGDLSVKDAVAYALDYNPQLQASLQLQRKGRGRVVEAYSAALPEVTLSGSYTRLDEGRPEMQTGSGGSGGLPLQIEEGDRNVYDVSVDVTQPIYRGGAIPIAQRAARLFAYLNEEMIRGAAEETVFRVSNAYYNALLARHLVDVEEAALESAEAHLEATESRRQEGVARDYDVLRARVEVSNIEAALIEQRQKKEQAYNTLKRAMGVSQKSEITLVDELERIEIDKPEFAEAVRTAFQNRPDLLQSSIQTDLSAEEVAEVRTRYLPHVNAFANYSEIHQTSEWDDEWQAGLQLNWSLFDGFARRGAMIQKEAELERQRILLNDAEQKAVEEVRDALLDIETAEEMVRSQEMNLQQAQETEDLVKEGYKEGVNSEIELLDARTAVAEARGYYYEALYRQMTAELSLNKALGKLARDPEEVAE